MPASEANIKGFSMKAVKEAVEVNLEAKPSNVDEKGKVINQQNSVDFLLAEHRLADEEDDEYKNEEEGNADKDGGENGDENSDQYVDDNIILAQNRSFGDVFAEVA